MIGFAEFAPDRSRYDTKYSDVIRNVLPRPDGYGPQRGFSPFSLALPAAPKGGFMARTMQNDVHVFGATDTKLYKFNTTTLGWTDVTRLAGGDYTLPAKTLWSFTQFGEDVIAVQGGDDPQVFSLGSSTNFALLSATAPRASFVSILGDFVLMSNVAGAQRRSQWSGLNDSTWWTPRKRSSDFQDYPDGGKVIGHASFDKGAVIFQEEAIREMIANYTSPTIFEFVKTEEDRGCVTAGSIVRTGRSVYYLARDGFYHYGQPSTPIGNNRVDEWFHSVRDPNAVHYTQGMDDPDRKIVYWRFKTTAHANQFTTDKLLAYSYGTDRWAMAEIELSLLAPFSTTGYTFDGLDTLGFTLDGLPMPLDSESWQGGKKMLAGFDSSYRFGFFDGPNMEATVETADASLATGRRAFVNGFRPVTDAATVYGTVAGMDTHGGTQTWNGEAAMNRNGLIPARKDARLHRFRLRIPAGTYWNDLHGIEPQARQSGQQ